MKRSLLESVLRRVTPLAADARVADADLLRRFAADRDEAAFAALVRRHGPLVWAVCRQLLPCESDAEDAFQATFLTLVRSAGTVRAPAALGAWLHSVACRVASNAKRAAGRRRKREQAAAVAEAVAPVAPTAWGELQAAVHEEVRRLPEPLRTAFVLCELEGRGQQEAAAALGWKLGTLSGRLTKARQQLLDRLAKRGIPATAVVAGATVGGAAVTAAPAALAAKTAALARAGIDLTGVVSQTVLELARGATEVSMTRTKLIAATVALAALIAAGTATTLIPLATAQPPAPATPAPPTPAAAPPSLVRPSATPDAEPPAPVRPPAPAAAPQPPGMTPRPFSGGAGGAWEYKFVPRKGDSLEAFQRLLNDYSAQGWEYCGTELLTVTDPAQKAQWGNSATIVFKRPRGAARGTTGTGVSAPANSFPTDYTPRPIGTPKYGAPATPASEALPTPAAPRYHTEPTTPPTTPNVPSFGGSTPAPKSVAPPATPADPFRTPAAVSAAPTKGGPKPTAFHLAHVKAELLQKSLHDLFGGRNCTFEVDPRTNTLMVYADGVTTKSIWTVIKVLDTPAADGGREE